MVILGVGAPLVYRLARTAPPEVAVADRTISLKSLKLDDPNLQPVVMQGNDGRTIILLVNKSELGEGGANAPLEVEPPKGGDL